MKFLLLFLFAPLALAAPKDLVFSDAIIYNPLKGSNATAGYVKIKNSGAESVTLQAVSAEGFKAIELHETKIVNEAMTMQKMDKIAVPASGEVVLAPGGMHIMLFDAKKTFKIGQKSKIIFKVNAALMPVAFAITSRPTASDNSMHKNHHNHH